MSSFCFRTFGRSNGTNTGNTLVVHYRNSVAGYECDRVPHGNLWRSRNGIKVRNHTRNHVPTKVRCNTGELRTSTHYGSPETNRVTTSQVNCSRTTPGRNLPGKVFGRNLGEPSYPVHFVPRRRFRRTVTEMVPNADSQTSDEIPRPC